MLMILKDPYVSNLKTFTSKPTNQGCVLQCKHYSLLDKDGTQNHSPAIIGSICSIMHTQNEYYFCCTVLFKAANLKYAVLHLPRCKILIFNIEYWILNNKLFTKNDPTNWNINLYISRNYLIHDSWSIYLN